MVMIVNNKESPIRITVYDKENPIRELASNDVVLERIY